VKEKAASRCGRVDSVGQTDELHVAVLEIRNELDELANGSAKSVEFPNYQRVARSQMRLRLLQPRAITATSTHLVRKNSSTAISLQRIDLEVEALLPCRYACVANNHVAIVAELSAPSKRSHLISLHSFRPFECEAGRGGVSQIVE
jgi:hypothetical protein